MDRSSPTPGKKPMPQWFRDLIVFQDRSWSRGVIQILNTVIPYLAIVGLMLYSVTTGWPYWITLLLAVPAALFLVRMFIIFHDCTHGSFLPSDRANRVVGFVAGVLAFTAFEPWRTSHLKHHATNGQLDHRGFGDVYTMTYEEYRDGTSWQRLKYRAYRSPIILFVFGPFYTFLINHRFDGLTGTPAARRSSIASNLVIAAIAVTVSLLLSFRTYLAVQLPVVLIAGTIGIWLFYVQHQFDPGYWARDDKWNQLDAALSGASYYKLPAVLRWFTGNIGIHHLHHLRPRIPNYRLKKAQDSVP